MVPGVAAVNLATQSFSCVVTRPLGWVQTDTKLLIV